MPFRERIDLVTMVRDFRTQGLCLSKGRGLGSKAEAKLRQITGCAGAGKSVLLCFNAWQFSVNKNVKCDENAKVPNDKLSDVYQTTESIYLIAPEPLQVQVLKEIMVTIRGQGLFSIQELKPIYFMTVKQFLESKPKEPFVVFLDEAQDLSADELVALKPKEGTKNILFYAMDRLQAIKGNEISVKDILRPNECVSLSIQYRQPIPLYLATLALAYRWNSTNGDIYLKWTEALGNQTIKNLLREIWGIYNCFGKETSKKEERSPYWSQELQSYGKIHNKFNKKRASYLRPGDVKHDYRLSLRCDAHPSSHWLRADGSAYGLRFIIDEDLDGLAPPVTVMPLSTGQREVAVFPPCSSRGADVLWVRFCAGADTVIPRANTFHLVIPVGVDASVVYDVISSHIKGREWPVVVIEGEPMGYAEPSGDKRIFASQLMYLIASRATTVLYLIGKGPSRDELKKLDARQAYKGETSYIPSRPGYVDGEFAENIGLRWGRSPSEPGVWWHLSWKNLQSESPHRVKPLFGLNPWAVSAGDEEQQDNS